MTELNDLRMLVDRLDEKITSLLDERMLVVKKIGDVKRSQNVHINDPGRETEVYEHVKAEARNPILKEGIHEIFQSIMKESKVEQRFFRSLALPFRSIGFIGMGFIGGSICKALRTKNPDLNLISLFHPLDDQQKALEKSWINRVYSSIPEFVNASDLIIIASPLSTLKEWADKIIEKKEQYSKKIIVMDVASIKGELLQDFTEFSDDKVEFVGTHPIIQSDLNGFDASQVILFVNAAWVITPHKNNTSTTLQSINQLIQYLGADPIFLNPETHDSRVALISHLPSFIAKLYYDFVFKTDQASFQIAGDYVKSFTKLVSAKQLSEVEDYNAQNVENFLMRFSDYLQDFATQGKKKKKRKSK